MKPCVERIISDMEDSQARREVAQRRAHLEAEGAHRAAKRLSAALKNGAHVEQEPIDPASPRHPEAP